MADAVATRDVGVIPLSPLLSAGQTRVVLSWGAQPDDLDLHAVTPSAEHIYWDNKLGTGINLDVDDLVSYGPETITITAQQAGTYRFYVHNYTGSAFTSLSQSGARVDVYDQSGQTAVFLVPPNCTSLEDYWDLFTLDGTTLTPDGTCNNDPHP